MGVPKTKKANPDNLKALVGDVVLLRFYDHYSHSGISPTKPTPVKQEYVVGKIEGIDGPYIKITAWWGGEESKDRENLERYDLVLSTITEVRVLIKARDL